MNLLHGDSDEQIPKRVAVDQEPVRDFSYDGAKKIVTIVVPYARSEKVVTVMY